MDKETAETGFELCANGEPCMGEKFLKCPFSPRNNAEQNCGVTMARNALDLLKEQEKEIKALRLLVEWATDCDFGFDQFPEEYERYKDEITDMKYIEGMIHVAKRTLEDHGAFEKGR